MRMGGLRSRTLDDGEGNVPDLGTCRVGQNRFDGGVGHLAIAADAQFQMTLFLLLPLGQPISDLRTFDRLTAEPDTAIGSHGNGQPGNLRRQILLPAGRQGQIDRNPIFALRQMARDQKENDQQKDNVDHRRHIESNVATADGVNRTHGRSLPDLAVAQFWNDSFVRR